MKWNNHLLDASIGACVFALVALARGGGTNSTTARIVTSPATLSLQDQATGYERAGRKREAAAIYEEIVRTNTVARKALAGRLVSIYAEVGETNKALAWAQQVMRDRPDPQAYLAAVHARLGQFNQSEEILDREVTVNTNATRAVILRWQLAELYERMGNQQKARMILEDSARLAAGSPLEAAAKKRLQNSNSDNR